LKQFLKEKKCHQSIPAYAIKRWFFTLIGGRSIEKDENDLPKELLAEINAWAQATLKTFKNESNLYRKTILNQTKKWVKDQNKPKKENIINNLLDVLIWLKDKQVALRDLKPDNLLVVGNKEKYPQFLNALDTFSIGIIDLETAISTGVSESETIKQPRLGGTPFYATPSHLLRNEILEATYHDLAQALHMQDWYATIGMIYKTITGKTLFKSTATLFPTIFRAFRDMYANPQEQTRTVQTMSQLFWQKAQHEFQENIDKDRETLSSIVAEIPLAVVKILKPQIQAELRPALETINAHVQGQNFFKSDKKQQDLTSFSSERIENLCKKWETETKDAGSKDAQAVIDFFQELAALKRDAEKISDVIEMLNRSTPAMPADILLNEMFKNIYAFMSKDEWQAAAVAVTEDDDISYDVTL